MTREEALKDLYNEEKRRLLSLSKDYKPKEDCVEQWKYCHERVDILKQMLNELPKDELFRKEKTGNVRQDFIIAFNIVEEIYNEKMTYYNNDYVYLEIINYGNENYNDARKFRLSYRVWRRWIEKGRYIREKQERIEEGKCTHLKAKVINDKVTELKWINPRKKAAFA